MMKRNYGVQGSLFSVSLEDVVPADHFLRKLDKAIDFSFIYDELQPYYCNNNGRYSTDPVVIVKSLLIAFLYGISSERRLEQELKYNVAYRWFLGLSFDEPIPDHSTVSQLRRRKFNQADLFQKLFKQIVVACAKAGLISGKLLVTDSTHVKANASQMSKIKVEVEKQTDEFFALLDKYENEERSRLGLPEIEHKKPEPKTQEQTKSSTDSDAGWLSRPGKPNGFHYLSHQTTDAENGIIVDVEVTPGNCSDNTPFLDQLERTENTLDELDIEVESVCADSAYDVALIHKTLEERGIAIFTPLKRIGEHTKTEYSRDDFEYDPQIDAFICPNKKQLTLSTLRRAASGVYREYKSRTHDCKGCPYREKCLAPSQNSRRITVNIFQNVVDAHHKIDGSAEYNTALKKRAIWCEATFAAQKARHNLTKLARRGMVAAKDHCLLSACAINLKRLIKSGVVV